MSTLVLDAAAAAAIGLWCLAAASAGDPVNPNLSPEARQVFKYLEATYEKKVLADARIPVLWRPLHEIDGGWFWWTDKKKPENTAVLWRLMYDHFTQVRKLNNLIWVYSAGVGKQDAEYRKRFYPGAAYVDISGIDIYGVDVKTADQKYWDDYRAMSQVSPGKMLACGECDAIPNPDLMQQGTLPKWLYALPWWGTPSPQRPADWAVKTMRHDFIVTLDELRPSGRATSHRTSVSSVRLARSRPAGGRSHAALVHFRHGAAVGEKRPGGEGRNSP